MFVGWLKQYISFAVQPIFVVTLASIMAKLIVFLLNSNLHFTVCKTCLIGWSIASQHFCLLPSYMVLPGLFGVDVGSINSPILSFESLIILYLVVNSANVLCNHLSSLASEIVTGSMLSMNLATATPSNPMSLYGDLKNIIGMSDAAIAGRQAISNAGKALGIIPTTQPRPNPQIQAPGGATNPQQPNNPGNINNPIGLQQPQGAQQPGMPGIGAGNIQGIAGANIPGGGGNIQGVGGGEIQGVGGGNIQGVGGGGVGILENIAGNNQNAPRPPTGPTETNQGGGNNE